MKRFVYSLIIGSALPCVFYIIGRHTTSSGPPNGALFRVTGWVLLPGYFLLGLFTSVLHIHMPQTQQLSIGLTVLLDCLLWSLAIRMLWEAADRIWLMGASRSHRAE
jgi:hypothetical protein